MMLGAASCYATVAVTPGEYLYNASGQIVAVVDDVYLSLAQLETPSFEEVGRLLHPGDVVIRIRASGWISDVGVCRES